VAPTVDTEDLVDALIVAELLGLSHRNSVSGYQRRYAEMPKPVVNLGPGRPMLWLRSEIEEWLTSRGPVHRGRPRSSSPVEPEEKRPSGAAPDGNRPPSGGGGRQQGGSQVTPRVSERYGTSGAAAAFGRRMRRPQLP
jgi:predicted DNA-binding transcriptional regulator AlpA